MGHPTALAIVHREEILDRIARGEQLTKIAQDIGYTSHQGIEERLGDDKDYKLAMKASLVGKLERREKQLEEADTNVAVTRSDRLLGHARWWAERLDPARFGVKQDAQGVSFTVVIQAYDKPEEKVIVLENQPT